LKEADVLQSYTITPVTSHTPPQQKFLRVSELASQNTETCYFAMMLDNQQRPVVLFIDDYQS